LTTDTELHSRVYELERLVDHLYGALNMEKPAASTTVSDRVRALARSGNAMEAIKLYRDETGCDLRTAKETVESLAAG
jgi:ribosomal protein L7/L12